MTKVNMDSDRKLNLLRTFLVYVSFTGIGSGMVVLGSSILDLQIQVKSDFQSTSKIIPTRAAGLIVGYFLAGLIGDRINLQVLMFLANAFTGLAFMSAPWNHTLVGLLIDFFISGIFLATNKVCCNTFIFSIWGKNSMVYLQLLYSCYDIGSFLTPFFIKPFLLPIKRDIKHVEESANITDDGYYHGPYTAADVKVQYPIMITGSFFMLTSIGFLLLHFFYPYTKSMEHSALEKKESGGESKNKSLKWLIIILMALFTHCAQSTTDLIGEMGPSFAVMSDLKLTKETGVTLVSVFWGTFTSYRLVFLLFLMFTSADRAKMLNVILLIASVIILTPHASHNETSLWVGVVLLGFGFCPLFAATYGSLIYPLIVGHYLNSMPIIFIYTIAALTISACILTLIIPVVGNRYLESGRKDENLKSKKLESGQNDQEFSPTK
ncbi:major facilitator superfamily domain-containing protein 4A-like isoform X2 [Brevipalpus obovatus]|uniref:major facilitator superfamily domain-containing protein 4A-like isoform X2 n=1 Tax=Brevipalpus obovatus TaxID=246614 RepID=UPI003D9EA358